jgi:hypothetical protein
MVQLMRAEHQVLRKVPRMLSKHPVWSWLAAPLLLSLLLLLLPACAAVLPLRARQGCCQRDD